MESEEKEKSSMENLKKIELENATLKSRLVHLEAQVNEVFHLKLKKVFVDKKLSALQAERLQYEKRIRNLKIRTSSLRRKLSEKDKFLQNMKWHIKKIWIIILQYGQRLENKHLLNCQENNDLRKEYEEWVNLMVTLDNGETKDVFEMLNAFPSQLLQVISIELPSTEPNSDNDKGGIGGTSEDNLQSDVESQSLITDSSIYSLSNTSVENSAKIRNKRQLSETKLRDQINRCKTTLLKRSNASSNSTSVSNLQSNTIDLNENISTVQSRSENMNEQNQNNLNEPSMKNRTTRKIDAELPNNFPSRSSTKRIRLQDSKPTKRKNSALSAGGSLSFAPARVRGRTLQSRAITRRQTTPTENCKSTQDESDCNIDNRRTEQHFENGSADTQREAQQDLTAIDKPKQLRNEDIYDFKKTIVNVDKPNKKLVKSNNTATEIFDYTILQKQMNKDLKYSIKPKSIPNMRCDYCYEVLLQKAPFNHSTHENSAHNSNRCRNNKISTSNITNTSSKNIEYSLVNNEASKNIMSHDTFYTQNHSGSQQDIINQFSFNIPSRNEDLDQANLGMFSANEGNKFSTSETITESCVTFEEKQVKITETHTVSEKPSSLSNSDSESLLVLAEDFEDETIAISGKICNEEMFGPTNPLYKFFFQDFRKMRFTQENFVQNVESLFLMLMDVSKAPNISVLLFHVLNYLHLSVKNVMYTYYECEDFSVLFPLDENCIATTLSLIELENPSHLLGLVNNAISTFHHLIISENQFSMLGLASLCRVFTQICKCQGDKMNPVLLCGDLLKLKKKFATYLIASIAGVWNELFQNGDSLSAEEVLFHSSIFYAATKKTTAVNGTNWNVSMDIISKCTTALPVNNSKVAIEMLQEKIQQLCKDGPCINQYLTSSLIILAAQEEWEWTQEHLVNEYIVPNLTRFGTESLNENAFDLYSNMYVDALLLQPGDPADAPVLTAFFESTSLFEGGNSVQESAAVALMRFVCQKNRDLPLFLDTWLTNNETKPKVQQIKPYFQRQVMENYLNTLVKDVIVIH